MKLLKLWVFFLALGQVSSLCAHYEVEIDRKPIIPFLLYKVIKNKSGSMVTELEVNPLAKAAFVLVGSAVVTIYYGVLYKLGSYLGRNLKSSTPQSPAPPSSEF
ncbi:MAG: hypothetical protein AB7R69_02495 [Candidatus Babeliales bacterium]